MTKSICQFSIILFVMIVLTSLASAEGVYVDADGSIHFGGEACSVYTESVLPLSNGNLLLSVVGKGCVDSSASVSDGYQTWLVCLEPGGAELWHNRISDTNAPVSVMVEQENQTVRVTAARDKGSVRWQSVYSLTDGTLLEQTEPIQVIEDSLFYDENVSVSYLGRMGTAERFLREEIYDAFAATWPRVLQLERPDGSTIWRKDSSELGMQLLGGLKMEMGTFLYGNNATYTRMQLAMIDHNGFILWLREAEELKDGRYVGAIQTTDGNILLCGLREIYPVDNDCWYERVFHCIDPTSGETLWLSTVEGSEKQASRMDYLCETPQGYLLADANRNDDGSAFLLIDKQGNELAYWEDTHWESKIAAAFPFAWGNEVWCCVYLYSGEGCVLIEIDMPNI